MSSSPSGNPHFHTSSEANMLLRQPSTLHTHPDADVTINTTGLSSPGSKGYWAFPQAITTAKPPNNNPPHKNGGPNLLFQNYAANAKHHQQLWCGESLAYGTSQLRDLANASIPGLSTSSSIRSLTPKGARKLISKQASRLDAFSGYPSRT